MDCQPFYVAKGETKFWEERIAPLLDAKGWKPARLAAATNIQPGTLSRWRNGPLKSLPDSKHLERVAAAFGITVDQLIGAKPIADYPKYVSGALTKEEYQLLQAFRTNEKFRAVVRPILKHYVEKP